MATKIFLPRLGESITEAVIGRWLKQAGDQVVRGEILAELETAKAMMELESPVKGTLLAVLKNEGETVHLEDLLAVVGAADEQWDTKEPAEVETKISANPEKKQDDMSPVFSGNHDNRILISPNAKRRMKELGIGIDQVHQIIKIGRITAKDIDALAFRTEKPDAGLKAYTKIPLNQIQKITARRMTLSAQTIPQFSISVEAVAEGLIRFTNNQKTTGNTKVTMTAVLISKTAEALKEHLRLNSQFDNDAVIQYADINMAVAVAAPEGLYVPVIHKTQLLPLEKIADELERVISSVKKGRLGIKDTEGATFTISNLGMKGINSFVPVIDPGQSAILGIGAVRDGIQWDENANPVRTHMINLTLAADHRVVSGAEASDFLATLKQLIESL